MKHLFFIIFLNNCASFTQLNRDMRESFYANDYKSAGEELEKLELQDGKESLLYHLEKAAILTRSGEHEKARKNFDIASRIVDDSYTVSVSSTTASFFINDSTQFYSGEDYEQVFLHIMAALSWLEDQNLHGARVEAKRINSRLLSFKEQEYSYQNDAFAWFLSGLIYEVNHDYDDALIDYLRSLKSYQSSYQKFSPHGHIPEPLLQSIEYLAKIKKREDILKKLKGLGHRFHKKTHEKNSIIIIYEQGYIATKHTKEFLFALDDEVIRFSFPYVARPHWSSSPDASVRWQNQISSAYPLVDMNALAHHSLEDRRGRLLTKGIARLIAKSAIVREARKTFGPIGGVVANIITAATETADTRSWSLLPRHFLITRIWLPDGTHKLKIQNGSRQTTRTIQISGHQTIFLRSY